MTSKSCRNVSYLHILLSITVLSMVLLDIRFHIQTCYTDNAGEKQLLIKGDDEVSLVNDALKLKLNHHSETDKNKSKSTDESDGEFEDDDNNDMSELPTPSTYRYRVSKENQDASAQKLRRIAPQDMPPESKPDWDPSDDEQPVRRFPGSLLVGFSKCGTSSLLAFLNVHPDIVTLDWETDYFCDRVYFKYSLHWYRMRMPVSTSHQITIEKSPCYITERKALERIRGFNSSMKVMVILRDPLTRIKSQHGQYLASFKASGKPKMSIEERYMDLHSGKLHDDAVKKWGIYTSRVENLYNIFPKEQIHIVDGDKFVRDPLPVLAEIEKFLGVKAYFTKQDVHYDKDKGFYCPRYKSNNQTECMGHQKGRPHVEMSAKLRKSLQDYTRPHTQRLFQVIGRRLDWDIGD